MYDNIIIKLTPKCYSINEIARKAKSGKLRVQKTIKRLGLNTSHFLTKGKRYKNVKPVLNKKCLLCGKDFTTKSLTQKFCSHKCSNSFEPHNPISSYKTICFKHHKHECVVCKENKIIDVHHYDHNHNNNDPKNLVPLCPTHHRYIHSRYSSEVKNIVDNYVNAFN